MPIMDEGAAAALTGLAWRRIAMRCSTAAAGRQERPSPDIVLHLREAIVACKVGCVLECRASGTHPSILLTE
jgi:hypothetical protein